MEYIHFNDEGNMIEVRCKGACGAVVVRVVSGEMRPTELYTELVIAMRDPSGMLSKHETAMCRACKTRILNDGPAMGELEAIYAQDVEQWMASSERQGVQRDVVIAKAAQLAARAPLRVLYENGRGEAA